MARSQNLAILLAVCSCVSLRHFTFVTPTTTPEREQSRLTMLRGASSIPVHKLEKDSSMCGALVFIGLAAAGGAGVAIARAQPRSSIACEAVGLLYATQTGNTETVAGYIAEETGLEAADVSEYGASDLAEFDGLIVGCPTWNTGADEMRSGTAWDDLLDEIKDTDFSGKTVAVFGCGDSGSYGDNFCDGIEELHETFKSAGAKMIGYVDSSPYAHTESKSDQSGKFLGCPFDEDNEGDQSEERAKAWVSQIKSEGMPL